MKKLFAISLIIFLLTGCAEMMLNASKQDCINFGYTPDTEAFANCVQNRFAQRDAALTQSLDTTTRGLQIMAQPPVYSAPPPDTSSYPGTGSGCYSNCLIQGYRQAFCHQMCGW
jgi:hypothetical protein